MTQATEYRTYNSLGNEIYGREMRATVGSLIRHDESPAHAWRRLNACECQERVDDGFPGADFRLPTPIDQDGGIACNVHVTGRTLQRYAGDLWVKIQVEFVGDCEPNRTETGWWMRVD